MQRHLRRLPHGADEQQNADHRHQRPLSIAPDLDLSICQARGRGKHVGVIKAVEIHRHRGDTQDKAKVANAVHQKCLHVGKDGGRSHRPEADQQVRDQSNRLPAEEKLHEIVGHHQHQHGEGEQRDIAEETLVAVVPRKTGIRPVVFIVSHIADGVDMDTEGDEGHHAHHHRGQLIDQESHLQVQAVAHHPGVDRTVEHLGAAGDKTAEHVKGQPAWRCRHRN